MQSGKMLRAGVSAFGRVRPKRATVILPGPGLGRKREADGSSGAVSGIRKTETTIEHSLRTANVKTHA
jgi:hypothetical protein